MRARIALAISALDAFALSRGLWSDRWEMFLEKLWRRVVAPRDHWPPSPIPRDFAAIDALFDPPQGGWPEGIGDDLRRWLAHVEEVCWECGQPPSKTAAVDRLLALLDGLAERAPSLDTFERSAFADTGGRGRAVPPAFFRDGLEWHDFASALSKSLRAPQVWTRREVAHALRWLGLPALEIRSALGAARADADPEVRTLAREATRVLFGDPGHEPEFDSATAEVRREDDPAVILDCLADENAVVRHHAIIDAAMAVLRNDPEYADLIRACASHVAIATTTCAPRRCFASESSRFVASFP